jgi:hypothetical protein
MFDRVRKMTCVISGDSVEAFIKKKLQMSSGSLVSGDLTAATDSFDPEIVETILNWVMRCRGFSEEEIEEALTFITRADLYESRDGPIIGSQKWGQNMGSDFSFPGLCLTSSLIGWDSLGLFREILKMSDSELETFLFKKKSKFGVNGDDIFGFLNPERWANAAERVGGIPERSKSPVNPRLMTVNSMLFRRGKRSLFRIYHVNLSFLMRAHTIGLHVAAYDDLADLVRISAYNPNTFRSFQLGKAFSFEVPKSLGGQGIYPPKNVDYILYQLLTQPISYASKIEQTIVGDGQDFLTPSHSITGWVSNSEFKSLRQWRHQSQGSALWAKHMHVFANKKSISSRIDSILTLFYDEVQADLVISAKADKLGLKWVSDFKIFVEDPIELLVSKKLPPLKRLCYTVHA